MYNPNTKPSNPYTAPWNQFKQPNYQWQPYRIRKPSIKRVRKMGKASTERNLTVLAEHPYLFGQGYADAQKAAIKTSQVQGQQQAQDRLRQTAAKHGTTYTGMADDASREQTAALRDRYGAQSALIDEKILEGNRRHLMDATGLALNAQNQRRMTQAQVQSAREQAIGMMNQATPSPASKVICAELYRQGLMSNAVYEGDEEYGEYLKKTNPIAICGYHVWAYPVVDLIKDNKFLAKVALFIAMPWANEMAYLTQRTDKGSFVGKCMLKIGMPICYAIGKIKISLNIKQRTNHG